MAETLKTRCKQGTLIITEQSICIELGSLKRTILSRSALTSLQSSMAFPSIFGMRGGTNLIFHSQGAEILHADLVKPRIAREICSLLGH